MTSDVAQSRSTRAVFDGTRYRIPVYQRAYAWGNDEVETLFRDIRDVRLRAPEGRYYIGTLVVHAERLDADGDVVFSVVDGQQRLTTLLLALANPTVRSRLGTQIALPNITAQMLTYEGRPRSTGDLAGLMRMSDASQMASIDDDGIRAASELISAMVERRDIDEDDIEYLLDQVHIVHTLLPARTDLNHYFEIMNSRGEQLEKHEIVKAHLMDCLKSDGDQHTFAAIWDLCSDMSKHVQAVTPKRSRLVLFGEEWNTLQPAAFDAIGAALGRSQVPAADRSILAMLSSNAVPGGSAAIEDDDDTPRYGAIIDFPNFLLHVLRLHVSASRPGVDLASVSLDDKSLVEQFKREFGSSDSEAVKRFAESLVESRFLFDNFVIRTDSVRDSTEDDSNWVIHRPHLVGEGGTQKVSPLAAFGDPADQTRVLMLQSMFQVTDSRRSYKEFLFGILSGLRAQWEAHRAIDPEGFIGHLEGLAAARGAAAQTVGVHSGTAVQHFLFNYLDYLLWREYVVDGKLARRGVEPDEFRFRYRKSVEHFYPVQPEREVLPIEVVNQFGNLCIMGRDENSRRSNLMPKAKINQYLSSDQSLKFQLMASIASARDEWGNDQMRRHGDEMLEMLSRATS